jgi:hypothetical protein
LFRDGPNDPDRVPATVRLLANVCSQDADSTIAGNPSNQGFLFAKKLFAGTSAVAASNVGGRQFRFLGAQSAGTSRSRRASGLMICNAPFALTTSTPHGRFSTTRAR